MTTRSADDQKHVRLLDPIDGGPPWQKRRRHFLRAAQPCGDHLRIETATRPGATSSALATSSNTRAQAHRGQRVEGVGDVRGLASQGNLRPRRPSGVPSRRNTRATRRRSRPRGAGRDVLDQLVATRTCSERRCMATPRLPACRAIPVGQDQASDVVHQGRPFEIVERAFIEADSSPILIEIAATRCRWASESGSRRYSRPSGASSAADVASALSKNAAVIRHCRQHAHAWPCHLRLPLIFGSDRSIGPRDRFLKCGICRLLLRE